MTVNEGQPEFWAIAYLLLPQEDRAQGMYATALNFCTDPDGGLNKDFETKFPKVLALLRDGALKTATVTTLKTVSE